MALLCLRIQAALYQETQDLFYLKKDDEVHNIHKEIVFFVDYVIQQT